MNELKELQEEDAKLTAKINKLVERQKEIQYRMLAIRTGLLIDDMKNAILEREGERRGMV